MQKKYLGNYIINRERQRDLRGDKVYKILTLVDLYFLKLRRDTLNSTIDKNRI